MDLESAEGELELSGEEIIGSAGGHPEKPVSGKLGAAFSSLGEVVEDIRSRDVFLDEGLVPNDGQKLLHVFGAVGDLDLEKFGVVRVGEGLLRNENKVQFPFWEESEYGGGRGGKGGIRGGEK